jgi:hypothetical protein
MSDIKNILSKLDSLSEQIGFRPGARDFSGQRIEPKFDISPVQDIAPPMGAVGGIAKPRIKVQPGQTPRQAISQAQQKIPTLTKEIPAAKPSVDPYGRMEPKGDITGEKSFAGKRKDPGGPLPTPSKSNEPTLETNKFPGYWKGKDSAAQAKKKMVGMENKKISEQEYSWFDRASNRLKATDPYKTYEPDAQGFKFSPEQEAWLKKDGGNPNRQDPDILKRMPGPKPPVSYFKNPEDQRRAQELNFGRQNLNTVRSAVGKEKLAPEKFPTSMTSNLGSIRPEIANMSRDEINRGISDLAARGGRRDSTGGSVTPTTPASAPVISTPAIVTPSVKPQNDVVSRNLNTWDLGPDETNAETKRLQRSRSLSPTVSPASPAPPISSPTQDMVLQNTARGRNQLALNRFNTSNMAENKHNTVNRLARKFENYIENKFGLVENNYIPKKKSLM